MRTLEIYQILKYSLEFTADITKYTNILEQKQRTPIAHKLLQAGLQANKYLFEAKTAILESDVKLKLQKAKKCLEDALYWYSQCVNSHYFEEDPRIIRQGTSLIKDISFDKSEYLQ